MKPGRYWIGDPCYMLDEEVGFDWGEFVDFTFEDDPSGRDNEGVHNHQGIRFAFFGTKYGDGTYVDQDDNKYPVDAGMLSCIPVDSGNERLKERILRDKRLGHVHVFDTHFGCSYDDGVIQFGDVIIDTF